MQAGEVHVAVQRGCLSEDKFLEAGRVVHKHALLKIASLGAISLKHGKPLRELKY